MTKTYKDMRELSAHKAKQIAKRREAKREVSKMIDRAYDSAIALLDFQDESERFVTRDELKVML